jgi:NlpC/P60 family putative phage cell wall peptidase
LKRRADIVAATKSWLGTPYHHQASVKGAGCDCLGLIRGVWRDMFGQEPEVAPAYSPGWDEVNTEEHMLRICKKYLKERALDFRQEGCVLIFRMKDNFVAKHCGIVTANDHMIHAQDGYGVVEVSLGAHWDRRVAGVFTFPGVR